MTVRYRPSLAGLSLAGLSLAIAISGTATAQSQTGSLHMTPQQARAYLQSQGIDLLPDNLPQQIIGGNADAVDAMITAGLDVNAKSSLPQAPLELAAMSCSNPHVEAPATLRIMNDLLQAGANPNAPGMQGLGPLMIAAQQCSPAVVTLLVKAGAKLDSRTPQGFTPLSMALVTKNYGAAGALVDAGARITPEGAKKLTDGSTDQRLNALVARATGP